LSRQRDNWTLTTRGLRALSSAGVTRPIGPRRLGAVLRTARELQATPAASIAIAAVRDPSGLAVADERGQLRWAELDRRARALAHAFVDVYGASGERPVAVMCRNHRGLIETLGAAARAGADLLALNTEFAPPQIAAALAGRNVAVLVYDEEFADRLEAAGDPSPRLLAWREDPATPSALDEWARTTADLSGPPGRRSRITILTSGTTGVPKAAARDLPVRALLGATTTLIEHLGLRRGEPVLVAPPLFHGFGLGLAAIAQALGAPIVTERRFDPQRTLALIERYRVRCLVAVPVMLQRILALSQQERERHDISSLRSVLSAGAPLSPTLSERFMDAFGEILHNAYGSTETGFGAIAGPSDLRHGPGTVGRAPLGSTIQVLDDHGRPAPAGEAGHIFVGGDLVFDGYDGGGSKETVGGLMNTGDLGHADRDGLLYVDGREDDMIVSGGENVFPGEVEDAFAEHPYVVEAVVVGVEDKDYGQRLGAFVVTAPGQPQSADELYAHLRTRLERYKLPREIVFCREIPRTATGKPIRRKLQATGEDDR
jgi:fatty-acyl-CoA synthase